MPINRPKMCRKFVIDCLAILITFSSFLEVSLYGHYCDEDTEKCYCRVKGTIGNQCEDCDTRNNFHMDPAKMSCYYTLDIDYQYTFNLSREEDVHFSQINFKSSPPKAYDADFAIVCSQPAKVNITAKARNSEEKLIHENLNCTTNCTKLKFPESTYEFKGNDGTPQTTCFVNVFDYRAPLWVRVSFSQYPVLNLAAYNITVATLKMMGIWNSTSRIVSSILSQQYSNELQSYNMDICKSMSGE